MPAWKKVPVVVLTGATMLRGEGEGKEVLILLYTLSMMEHAERGARRSLTDDRGDFFVRGRGAGEFDAKLW